MTVIVKDYLDQDRQQFDPVAMGKRLKKSREDAGLDQIEWAERIAKSQQTISNWECGRASPFQCDLIKYSVILGADLHWLITGERLRRRSK